MFLGITTFKSVDNAAQLVPQKSLQEEFMSKRNQSIIEVQGTAIAIRTQNAQDYLSLTDIARVRNSQEPFAVINNWMRNRITIEFMGIWEKLSNPDFKPLEFDRFKNEADLLNVTL